MDSFLALALPAPHEPLRIPFHQEKFVEAPKIDTEKYVLFDAAHNCNIWISKELLEMIEPMSDLDEILIVEKKNEH